MTTKTLIRIMSLIYPIEKHVGHWACSSDSIILRRIIMEGNDIENIIEATVRDFQPHAIAIIGKKPIEYNNLLDKISEYIPVLKKIPRIYRCQNTSLKQRGCDLNSPRNLMAKMSHWFKFACDDRFSIILVQTLPDVDILRKVMPSKTVFWCPYGYDPEIFDTDLPDLERTTDVGCYFSLKNDNRRIQLVKRAKNICEKRGWTFQSVDNKYWKEYAQLIRTTKICLHSSLHREIPFRIYESTSLGAVFLTDPLECGIEKLFSEGKEYLTYQRNFSNLESVLEELLEDKKIWNSIRQAGKEKAKRYSWPQVSENYVVPVLKSVLKRDMFYV